ncbi:hypothetical protein HAX54_039230 [Datura stramonium]|uniref:Uncharacterized protein n=1 Tax=Datura stramonium TaxID=4076 RepID=A0ABS8VKY7_DATST|nr:hypothetical protein [Datura stramonium]
MLKVPQKDLGQWINLHCLANKSLWENLFGPYPAASSSMQIALTHGCGSETALFCKFRARSSWHEERTGRS